MNVNLCRRCMKQKRDVFDISDLNDLIVLGSINGCRWFADFGQAPAPHEDCPYEVEHIVAGWHNVTSYARRMLRRPDWGYVFVNLLFGLSYRNSERGWMGIALGVLIEDIFIRFENREMVLYIKGDISQARANEVADGWSQEVPDCVARVVMVDDVDEVRDRCKRTVKPS